MLRLGLIGVPQKLKDKFPIDSKYDITIVYQEYQYKLQNAYLRLYSKYFDSVIKKQTKLIIINENFSELFLYNILSCFYGYEVQILRKDALQYFQIIRFLKIASLQKIILQDISKNLQMYDFFEVLQTAHHHDIQSIFEQCLIELSNKKFTQITQFSESLLSTSITIFKLVLNCYNKQQKKLNLLTPYNIEQLIINYCKVNNLDYKYTSNLKIQLIDKNSLTSQQYRDIFLMDQFIVKYYQQNLKKKKSKNSLTGFGNISVSVALGSGNNNTTYENKITYKSLALSMETTYHQKIQEQLRKQQLKLRNQIKDAQKQFHRQSSRDLQIHETFSQISNSLKNNYQSKFLDDRIHRMDRKLNSLQNGMNQTDRKLKDLLGQAQQIFDKYETKQKSMMEMSQVENSKSSLYFGNNDFNTPILTPKNNKIANYHENPQIDKPIFHKQQKKLMIEAKIDTMNKNLKSPRNTDRKTDRKLSGKNFLQLQKHLQFSERPLTITSQRQLSNLAEFIAPDRLKSKRLDLILRRSINTSNYGLPSDLKEKKNILILFRTQYNKLVGGKISSQIPSHAQHYVQDLTAFIFSLTENKKFKIKKAHRDEAIMINDGYIFCFGCDLMISEKYISDNYCSWPFAYQANKEVRHNAAKWLVGDDTFGISQLECYQIRQNYLSQFEI